MNLKKKLRIVKNINIFQKLADKNKFLFEGKETNVKIYGLLQNKEYELRIRTFYKDAYSNWSVYFQTKLNGYNIFGGKQNDFNNINVYGLVVNDHKNNNHNQGNSLFANTNNKQILWKKIN